VQASEEFPGEAASVAAARRFVRGALASWGADGWEFAATSMVSELATNSVLHARTAFRVELAFNGQVLRLEVSDASRRAPVRKPHSQEATTGRGLDLVVALSSSWGVEQRAEGKTVWWVVSASPDQLEEPSNSRVVGGQAPMKAGPKLGRKAAVGADLQGRAA